MALNQVGLERLNTATTKKIGTNKNLIINGAMQVAQRGTSSTTNDGYFTVDRMYFYNGAVDENCTTSQSDVASGTTPYTSGFRKAFKVQNGNQTSGAGAGDEVMVRYNIESQDIANSGWNYTSSSSFLTLSYWVKSSVAQNFYVNLITFDGTQQNYVTETGSLTADTWTKVTKTIPGNSNLQFDNNNERGMFIQWNIFKGTNDTGTRPLNAWAAYSGTSRVPDMTSTWYTTNDATFEITGVQLEVGSVATDFEHRSISDELLRCYRYFQILSSNTSGGLNAHSRYPLLGNGTNSAIWYAYHKATMRVKPSLVKSGITTSTMDIYNYSAGATATFNNMVMAEGDENHSQLVCTTTNNISIAQIVSWRWSNNADCYFAVAAEI